jgi:tetratricopeptide (TPR) repeat protein
MRSGAVGDTVRYEVLASSVKFMQIRCQLWRCEWVLLLFLPFASAFPQAASSPDDQLHQADLAFHQGYAAVQNGDLDTARIAFQKAVQLAPEIAEGHGALGSVLLQLGQPAQAIPELERSLAIKPADPATQINLAVAYEEAHNYEKSLAIFRALDQSPNQADPLPLTALLSYARALTATQAPDLAAARLRTALQSAPQNSPDAAILHDALGSLRAQRKDWPEAQSEFEQAIAADPNLAAAHEHLGVTLFAQQQVSEALRELTAATQLSPNAASAHLELGRVLIAAGKDDEAVPILKRTVELAPDSLDAKYQLALALQGSGQEQQSIPLFQQVVEAQPRNAPALTNLALALVQTGKSKEAVPLYQRALVETPNDPLIHQDLGVAYLQQSNLEDAIREFRAGIQQSPDTYELHYNLGLALKLKDDAATAETELKLAAQLNPESPDPPFTLGILKMQKGQFDEAAKQLQLALKLNPGNGDAWAILGSVYKEENDLPQAAEALRQAVKLLPNQPGAHVTLAGVLALQGQKDEAAAERKIAADLTRAATNRQRATFAVNSGNLLLQQGKYSEAVERFQEAVASDPTYLEGHSGLVKALTGAGRTAEADAERQKIAQLEKTPATR